MSQLRELTVNLSDWETRYILGSIEKELLRLKYINETSDDEDEQADAGNDFLELSTLKDRLVKEAISTFGNQITEF